MIEREYFCRIPVRLVKSLTLSPRAKMLYVVLSAFADWRTGRTHVSGEQIECLMGCGPRIRHRAQRELEAQGWLQLELVRTPRGSWARRVYTLKVPEKGAAGPFWRCGEIAPLIFLQSSKVIHNQNL